MATVLLRIVSELPLMAIVFWRTVVATEQPASVSAVMTINNARVLISLLLPCVRDDDVGRLLADHVNGADDEQAWDARKHRCIDNAESAHTVHLEIAAQHTAAFFGTDRTGARRMVTPRMPAHEIAQRFLRRKV